MSDDWRKRRRNGENSRASQKSDVVCARIGVNTAIASTSGTNSGVGFAIPVDIVKRVAPELIAHGRCRHPQLGVTGGTITPEMIEAADLPVEMGVLISTVEPGSPAEIRSVSAKARARPGNGGRSIAGAAAELQPGCPSRPRKSADAVS